MKITRPLPLRRATATAVLLLWTAEIPTSASPARIPQAQPAAAESTVVIEHDPLPCLTTSAAPRVDATVRPDSEAASGRVYWRISNGPAALYYTEMTRNGSRLEALLPRVTAKADSVEYSIEITDTQGRTRRTANFVAPLVTSNCIPRGIVPLVEGLGLTIGLTDPSQARIPAGVNAADVASVTLASGETVPASAEDRRRAAAPTGGGAPRKGGVSKGLLIGAGVLAAGGIAAAAGGGGGSSASNPGGVGPTSTPTATPTPTQPPAPTATPTVLFRFVQAEATWSGTGDVDVLLLDASGAAVPGTQTVAAGCESTAARTERVLLQGANVRPGNYQVRLTGKTCGAGTPASISTLLTVQTDTQPKCPSGFVIVPVGQTVAGCTFTIP